MLINVPDDKIFEMLDQEIDAGELTDEDFEFDRLDPEIAREFFKNCPNYEECESPKELGKRGEAAARAYLDHMGFEVVDSNWKCRFGEADVVARDGEDLVFVEVKTRSGVGRGFPEEAVTAEKRRKYEKIAGCYLADHDFDGSFAVRFDVIGILVLGEHRAFLRHHRNAFYAAEEL